MARVYNFAAGPANLPEEVLKEAAEEMLDYKGTGMSVMEMSHRSKAFDAIIKEAEQDLRDLYGISDDYAVMFLQGGASTQFAAIPMNLMKSGKADYIVTGNWSNKAYKEAQMYGDITLVANTKDKNYTYIPDLDSLEYSDDADYLYVCWNETIHGTTYRQIPPTKANIVADVSSCFLSEPMDISKFGVVYGGAQKNIGPAGVVVAIVRKDLISDEVMAGTPTMLKWKTQMENDSMYNTPPCYAIYICGKVFKWIKSIGGLEAMKERNEKKAAILYDFLDKSEMFKSTVEKKDRSLMNVPFVTGDDALDKEFIAAATAAGLVELKGHRSVGGMRASIYNAMPIEGVEKLVAFMEEFEKAHK
ncbi:MAG: 3-phosphoserine/phosphohydroxythreonine transaminase [Eggerthellales bacterium]|nr:3-phosphoserine/phosphohydroxythreonine transaminase [Eggerthellales bacterium]